MTNFLAISLCLLLSFAWAGWLAGMIYGIKKAERDDLNARDQWARRVEVRK